ncbi:HK97-gp10 family putative phage morphogenesis protein [Novacetimonas pomaceti]|uniref:hypothetical protein n=1 Tax=Novacetimonas pomaceti TaxID=2021998 RepID=UPI001C2D155D|nr:hypothetical protein [Novacetimonas pomaceti]MBV1833074.1 hypothetical protein [Novacetimonas pomaceti]
MTQGFTVTGDGFIRMQAVLRDMRGRISQAATLDVGWDDRAKYPDGTFVADVARYQEFGTRTIPARPFVRPAVMRYQEEWRSYFQSQLEGTNQPLDVILERLGLVIAGDIQKSIVAVTTPPLAPSTLRQRLKRGYSNLATASKPLVDTGLMLRSVRSKVTMA